MKQYNLKLHWLFTVAALLVGFGIGYMVFHKNPTQEDSFVEKAQEKASNKVNDAIDVDSILDVKYDSIDKSHQKIIREIHEKARKSIAKGVYPAVYDSLVRSNHRRGIKRYN